MKKQPHYRLVAIDGRAARNGKELEILGTYNPKDKENRLTFNSDRIQYWLSCGAQMSDTAKSLLTRNGALKKKEAATPAA